MGMRSRVWQVFTAAVVCGLVLGSAVSYLPDADGSRNASGTYSLPAGNPVVTGTTVTTSWANTTLADISTELTSSLDRSGRGAMLSNLNVVNGTAAAPAVRFDSDPDTGMYRVGTGNLGLSADSTKVIDITSAGATFTGTTTTTGVATFSSATRAADGAVGTPSISFTNDTDSGWYRAGAGDIRLSVDNGARLTCTAAMTTVATGLTVTENTTDSTAITSTGNGTGHGISSFGGGTSGVGGVFTGGAPNGAAVVAVGDGTGSGISATGGDNSGAGGSFTGGAANGNGANFTGTGTGNAIQVGAGHAKFTGSNPSSSTGFTNTLTPMNFIKAWGVIDCNSGSAPTLAAGFNVASVAMSGTADVQVNIADDMAGALTYAVIAMSGRNSQYNYFVKSEAVGSFVLEGYDIGGAAGVDHDSFTATTCVNFLVLGAQ